MEIDKNGDDLELLNRLLEQLHQADYKVLGSIVLNVYKEGCQHVDRVENQYIGPHTGPPPKEGGKGKMPLPEALASEEAMALWEKMQAAGYIDEDFQPLLSRSQSALLADAMAERLGIKEKWMVFETLWQRKNMYRDYYKALYLQQSLTFQDKIKRLFR